MDLHTDVRFLRGVGENRAKLLEKLGVTDLESLLSCFPRAYEDRSVLKPIAALTPGESCCISAIVATEPRLSRVRRGLDLVKLRVADETAVLEITYFNQPYRRDFFHVGDPFLFYGKVEGTPPRLQMTNPVCEREGRHELTGRLMPVYTLTAGVTQRSMLQWMRQALDACLEELPDALPAELRQRHALCAVRFAYENIHFPADAEALACARRRLAFEELLLLSLALRRIRAERTAVSACPCRENDLAPFFAALPFTLTGAQRRAAEDCVRDMASGRPMSRLCQGDVGSGKTMVAAAAVFCAVKNGLQCALMAPTEILAEQHFRTLSSLLGALGVRCALLTGATGTKDRRALLASLAAGEIDLLIGTHALLTPEVSYRRLGLVITDEQHRFGVEQRAALAAKGERPHLLVMSATPIPRTLALVLYGDLDVSVIDELPRGRKRVETFAVPSSYHERIYAFIRKLAAEGRQAYIICPMVAENDELPDERKAVLSYAEALQRDVFPTLRVAAVHGRMKPKEKEAVMRAFAAGETDVLVSTTVVEVGVDVPNAAVMLIENAECFGLSQLHQLRGRVGRGDAQSYCILVSDNTGEENRRRLKVLSGTNDGFAVAEEDLKLRGPGDFFGQRQHGLPLLRAADLAADVALLQEAQTAAETLLASDPDLARHPLLRERIAALFARSAESLN